jgi:hypothetical protein
MLSRITGLLMVAFLFIAPFVVPMGPVHSANAFIAGSLALLFGLGALADERARLGLALVGGWVALAPFIFWSTLAEQVVTVSWGVSTFVLAMGPLSEQRVTRFVPVPALPALVVEEAAERRVA